MQLNKISRLIKKHCKSILDLLEICKYLAYMFLTAAIIIRYGEFYTFLMNTFFNLRANDLLVGSTIAYTQTIFCIVYGPMIEIFNILYLSVGITHAFFLFLVI